MHDIGVEAELLAELDVQRLGVGVLGGERGEQGPLEADLVPQDRGQQLRRRIAVLTSARGSPGGKDQVPCSRRRGHRPAAPRSCCRRGR